VLVVASASGVIARAAVHTVPAAGGRLTIHLAAPSRFLNPLLASTDVDVAATSLAFPGLTRLGPTGSYQPSLSSGWSVSNHGRTFTFSLRSGLRWQDGRSVTSSDVAYTYRILASPGFPNQRPELVGMRIHTPNARTVVFTLPRPDYTFVQNSTVGIVPSGFAHSMWPIGSGAFRVHAVTPGTITLAATGQSGSAGQPRLSQVVLPVGPGTAGSSALACASSFFSPASAVVVPTTRLAGLILNVRGMRYAAMRMALIATVARFLGPVTPTPTWPSTRLNVHFGRPADILRRAGWHRIHGYWTRRHHSPTVTLAASTNPLFNRLVHAVVAAWRRTGFHVKLIRRPFPTLVRSILYPGAFGAAIVDWDFGGPEYDPGRIWSRSSALNFARLDDPRLNRLSRAIQSNPSPRGRNRLRAQYGVDLVRDGAALGLRPEQYRCSLPPMLHGFRRPSLVADAAGLVQGAPDWYVNTRLSLRNPF